MSADSLRFDIVGHVMLVVHADMPPDPADWARLSFVRTSNLAKLRGILVIAPPRAVPNAEQRADIARSTKEKNASIAVVTDSAMVRGVAGAIGFLGVPVRAFAPVDLASALNYLVVPACRHAELIERIEMLKAQLHIRPALEKPPKGV